MAAEGSIEWDALAQSLPAAWRGRFDSLLRRSLKRQLARATTDVPSSIRSEAVGTWRRLHMADASKSARRRKGYNQLKNDPSYQQIERTLLERHQRSHAPSAVNDDVADMGLAEACDAYRATKPQLPGSALDSFLHECLRHAATDLVDKGSLVDRISARLEKAASTQDVSSCARLRRDGAVRTPRSQRRAFSLYEVTDEHQVADLVRRAHLVEGLCARAYGSPDVSVACTVALHDALSHHDDVAQLMLLLTKLFDSPDALSAALWHEAGAQAPRMASRLSGPDVSKRIARALIANPRYAPQYERARELKLKVRKSVPATPMEAYPLARTMHRRFVVHVGPTNSGKTYSALQRLMAAPSGAYLGPLRLLAFEQYDRMNREGVPCTLLTGEERVDVAGAHHVASTIEMADLHHEVDVAIIDEAQMIADPDRGHNWTSAILGIPTREVHVCCAPHAESVVRQLVALCEDEIEVVRHKRLVPLLADRGPCRIPADVMPGDALIVFSRRSVHAVAADVAAAGLRASLVYGALPHDVRHEEARRFDAGETDVVVATDAIGMGMNLPIRRIVFVEQEKYDGRMLRDLRPDEVQQIAGRAGRFGRYDRGYYHTTRRRGRIVELYRREVPSIDEIPVGIPDDIALVNGATLGESIRQWMGIMQPKPFQRIDVSRELGLLAEVEQWAANDAANDTDTKQRELSLISMPFDEHDRRLKAAWRRMAESAMGGETLELPLPPKPSRECDLGSLEADYHYCDLLYSYERSFGSQERMRLLSERREQISRTIMALLAQSSRSS